MMTDAMVIERLREAVQKAGTQSALAAQWGIAQAYLSDVLRGKREPGPAILRNLGITKRVVYEQERKPRGSLQPA